jgi:hypothetical protein
MAELLKNIIFIFEEIGRPAHLSTIYKRMKAIIPRGERTRNFQAAVRGTIYNSSSDSDTYRGINDYFYHETETGEKSGIWGLRKWRETQRPIDGEDYPPARRSVEVSRIIRDSRTARKAKRLHKDRCQVCGEYIEFLNGNRYSEAHHIRPLGGEHRGRDCLENILVLCPNHHAMMDYGAIKIDLSLIHAVAGHNIELANVKYHNTRICGNENPA